VGPVWVQGAGSYQVRFAIRVSKYLPIWGSSVERKSIHMIVQPIFAALSSNKGSSLLHMTTPTHKELSSFQSSVLCGWILITHGAADEHYQEAGLPIGAFDCFNIFFVVCA
jgi:hypothetical protein